MRVTLVAPNDALNDPRAMVSRRLLERAGHEVSVVTPVPGDETRGAVRTRPRKRTLIDRFLRRDPTPEERAATLTRSLAQAAISTDASIFIPTDPRALSAAIAAARAVGGSVSRDPKLDHAGDVDLVDLAPTHPQMAAPPAGIGVYHTPGDPRAPYSPEPGRHAGKRVVLCYRRSEINPGRYLEEGLRRSGAEVRVETRAIDLSRIDPDTDVVVFVEAPYPALAVTGETAVPTLFWFHHGEHHLHANLRLADRYRADAVLMAHSWHLAFWSSAPVHRFPFGVATELLHPGRPMEDRRYDVAMVGAKLHAGGPYDRRQSLVADLEESFPTDRLGFREQVSAGQMAELYADARLVINEGGTRHYPITMRVLEAVGSGAVLLSDPLPGMEMLLEEGSQYALLGDNVVGDVTHLLEDQTRLQAMADSALESVTGLHTYDHRVDELFEIAGHTQKRRIPARDSNRPALASIIDDDVEVQRIAQVGAPDLVESLPDREVWDADKMDQGRLAPSRMESVAIRSDDVTDRAELLRSARRYIYAEGAVKGLEEYLEVEEPQAIVERVGDVTRVDLRAPSYRIMEFEVKGP